MLASESDFDTPDLSRDIQIVDSYNPSKLTLAADVHCVRQRVEREETGTLFLLGDSGLSVVRRHRLEEAFHEDMTWLN